MNRTGRWVVVGWIALSVCAGCQGSEQGSPAGDFGQSDLDVGAMDAGANNDGTPDADVGPDGPRGEVGAPDAGAADADTGPGDADTGRPDLDSGDADADAGEDADIGRPDSNCPPRGAPAIGTGAPGETFVTYIPSAQGNVAVRVTVPARPRYRDHTQVVVNVATFFTTTAPFYTDLDADQAGLIHVAYIWPGAEEPRTGACSDGVFDHGGPLSIAALRDVVRYALGDLEDIESQTLAERLRGVRPSGVGLWAFSHPGIAATNVLARHQGVLGDVAWFVGRENPTQDQHCAVEFGHFGGRGERVLNPLYSYPRDYNPGPVRLDLSSARWNPRYVEPGHEDEPGRAYFDLDGDGFDTDVDHVLSFRVPKMWGKRYLSRSLTHALRDNGLRDADWPADLATPEEADAAWAERTSTDRYPELRGSGLRVMLLFATRQHVQPLPDALSVHSAYDGFVGAGLWVRINPDRAYAEWATGMALPDFGDHDPNTEPADWSDAGQAWGYADVDGLPGADLARLLGLASVAEMADRHEFSRWEGNLDMPLAPGYPRPSR